jgi:poly(hydroxyalkanoate) depolymerase family esterase
VSTPIKAPLSSKLQRFRARLAALIARKRWFKPGRTHEPPPLPAPASVQPEPLAPTATIAPVQRTDARTFEGSARSSDGATSPWLLLPPERAYRLYVPPHVADGEPLPLVVMIHGCRETAEEFERGTRMSAIANHAGFAVLYPDQATFANIRRCWNWFEPNTAAGNGECAIILEMIKAANERVALDRARVYVAGMSSGGALAALLAYHHPDVFAAAAVHSGLPPMMPPSAAAAISAMEKGVRIDVDALADSYWNTHEVSPPPLMILHGNADETVTERNATGLMKLWEKLFESAPQATPLTREEREFERSEAARAYSQVDLQREGRIVVRSLRIHGLAHDWSGGDAELPFNDAKGPDASVAIWKFFERQRR